MARTHKEVRYLPKSKVKAYTPVTAARDVEQAFKVLEGRWKLLILFHLFGGKILRFSELERAIPAISQKMLIQQLRQMENDGMVRRIVHHQVPPTTPRKLARLTSSPPVSRLLTEPPSMHLTGGRARPR
jgi:DNA-binding HxlR family transcriptional regulator